jgi:hypothetical protein
MSNSQNENRLDYADPAKSCSYMIKLESEDSKSFTLKNNLSVFYDEDYNQKP